MATSSPIRIKKIPSLASIYVGNTKKTTPKTSKPGGYSKALLQSLLKEYFPWKNQYTCFYIPPPNLFAHKRDGEFWKAICVRL